MHPSNQILSLACFCLVGACVGLFVASCCPVALPLVTVVQEVKLV